MVGVSLTAHALLKDDQLIMAAWRERATAKERMMGKGGRQRR